LFDYEGRKQGAKVQDHDSDKDCKHALAYKRVDHFLKYF
jgi:hypothetical protein